MDLNPYESPKLPTTWQPRPTEVNDRNESVVPLFLFGLTTILIGIALAIYNVLHR